MLGSKAETATFIFCFFHALTPATHSRNLNANHLKASSFFLKATKVSREGKSSVPLQFLLNLENSSGKGKGSRGRVSQRLRSEGGAHADGGLARIQVLQ